MMLTEDQKLARRHSIGSSDMAAVLLGRNSFGTTRHDVWAGKTGKLDDWEGNAATRGGNRYESLILDMAEESLGPLERDTTVRHTSLPLAANLDGRVIANGEPVEAKAVFKPWRDIVDVWGEPGSDHVPDDYLIQVHVAMMCCASDRAQLWALLNRLDATSFAIELNRDLEGMIGDAATRLWSHVESDTPPWDSELSARGAKLMRRQPGKRAAIDPLLAIEWNRLRVERLDVEKREKDAREAMLIAMGDAEFAEADDVDIVSYALQQGADTIDRAAMKSDGIYDTYATPNSFRVLRPTKELQLSTGE